MVILRWKDYVEYKEMKILILITTKREDRVVPGNKKRRIEAITWNNASGSSFQDINTISDVTMVLTSDNPAQFDVTFPAINTVKNTISINRNIGLIDFHGTMRFVRILGLMTLISYMVVILFIWIYANSVGYVYFSAGEPELLIKYPEWVLGFIGILVAVDFLKKELKGTREDIKSRPGCR